MIIEIAGIVVADACSELGKPERWVPRCLPVLGSERNQYSGTGLVAHQFNRVDQTTLDFVGTIPRQLIQERTTIRLLYHFL